MSFEDTEELHRDMQTMMASNDTDVRNKIIDNVFTGVPSFRRDLVLRCMSEAVSAFDSTLQEVAEQAHRRARAWDWLTSDDALILSRMDATMILADEFEMTMLDAAESIMTDEAVRGD